MFDKKNFKKNKEFIIKNKLNNYLPVSFAKNPLLDSASRLSDNSLFLFLRDLISLSLLLIVVLNLL